MSRTQIFNLMMDCTDYLINELLKLEEITVEEAQEYVNLLFRDKKYEEAGRHPVLKKMATLINFLGTYRTYLFFKRKFGDLRNEMRNEHKYILYMDDDMLSILLQDIKTNDIILDKEFIKNVFQKDIRDNTNSMNINLLSFDKNDKFYSVKCIRNYIIDYFNLDIKVDDISIHFIPTDIYTKKERKEWDTAKKIKTNFEKVKEEIKKRYLEKT